MIYLDTSVALAHLLSEDRRPPTQLWSEELVSSRLLEYEIWNRLHARELGRSHGDAARLLVTGLALAELSPAILRRALEPFPVAVRTLDALHLATASWLRERGKEVEVATYDARMAGAAASLGFTAYAL